MLVVVVVAQVHLLALPAAVVLAAEVEAVPMLPTARVALVVLVEVAVVGVRVSAVMGATVVVAVAVMLQLAVAAGLAPCYFSGRRDSDHEICSHNCRYCG